jgi:hypothetical protein
MTQPTYDPADDVNENGRIDQADLKAIVDQTRPQRNMPWWQYLLGPSAVVNRNAERDEWFATVSALEEKYGIELEPYAQASYEADEAVETAQSSLALENTELANPEGGELPYGDAAAQTLQVASQAPAAVDDGTERQFGPGRPLGVTEGMLELGVIREQLGSDGSIMYQSTASGAEMKYAQGNVMAVLESFAPDQLAAFRQAAYVTGYMPDPTLTETVNQRDVDVMQEIMGDANIAGLAWNELLNRNAATGMRQTFGEFNDWRMRQDFSNAGQKLQEYALDNGVVLSEALLRDLSVSVSAGQLDERDAFTFIKEQYVKRMYPNWAREVDMGLTIKELASPMMQYAADRLGVDPSQINVFDPSVKQFLKEMNPEGELSKTGFNRMNDIIEQHPYWQYSPDAAEKLGAIQSQIMQEFGFGTDPTMRPPQGYAAFGGLSGHGTMPGMTGFSGGDGTGMPTQAPGVGSQYPRGPMTEQGAAQQRLENYMTERGY